MERLLMIVLYVALTFIFLFISKKISDALTRFDDDAAIERGGNTAVAFRRFGLYVGISIAITGVMTGGVSHVDILIFLLDGAVTTAIFFVAHFINEIAIVPRISNNELIKAGSIPTGILEAGSFIATGVLLNGAFGGAEGGALYSVAFFFLGQAFLILAAFIYQRIYRFNITKCMAGGNMSAGLSIAGLLVAYSLILRASVSGGYAGWADSIGWLIVSAATGLAALLVFGKIADMLFLPKAKISEGICEDNTAVTLIVQAITISLSFVISTMI